MNKRTAKEEQRFQELLLKGTLSMREELELLNLYDIEHIYLVEDINN